MTMKSFEDYLQEIGETIAAETDNGAQGAFLYAEVGPDFVYELLFQESESGIECLNTSNALSEVLLEAWQNSEPGKAWATISYSMTGDNFDVILRYSDEISEEEDTEDRVRQVLKARYGDRPIKYPQPPAEAMTL
jgi:hypothetical protein